jgi:predicted nucleic acid-binding protein
MGQRRQTLDLALAQRVLPLFEGRVLPFSIAAAEAYGDLRARARAAGKAIGTADGYIAAIAAAHGLAVATRDASPFEAAGVRFIRP